MFLNLHIRLFLLTLFISSCIINAQNTNDSLKEAKDNKTQKTHFNIEVSGIVPIAIGDNFAADGFDFNYGIDLSFKGYFNNFLFFGLKLQHLRADVANKTLVGFFEHSNVNSYFAMGGYRFIIDKKVSIEPSLALGLTVYNNKKTSTTFDDKINFEDDATSLVMSTSISYKISDNLKIYVKPEYRIDFTDIDTSPIRQDFFDEAHYINILFGLRIGY